MTNSDLEYFKKLLEERKLQIKKNILDATDEINGLRDSGASDEFDFANISADSILEQSISSKQKQELNEIGVALTKIANKTYGICEMCEDDIDIERLKVNPHARHCISCRELIEKNVKTSTQTKATYKIEYSIDLPIASWVILPVGLFALLSILHMSYYGFKNFLDARAVRSDLQLYNILAKEVFLGLESNKEFKTDLFLNPSEATKALSPWLNLGEPKFNNDDLKLAYETSQKIKNGEVCEIKKVKLLKTNPLFIQNEKNKIKADYKYALSVLSTKGDINESLYKEAYNALIEYVPNADHHKL